MTHLEWLINSETSNRSYNSYLKPLIDMNEFYSRGECYKNGNIQNQIHNWCQYENCEVYFNIQPNYGNYKTCNNY